MTPTPGPDRPPPDAPGWRSHLAPLAVAAIAVVVPVAVWWSLRGHHASSSVTIAVLPFENLSGDPQRNHLAAGLTEETIAVLGPIDPSHVRVIGRASTLAYERSGRPLQDMRQELGLDYAVQGSIRAEGARMKITARLVRVRDEGQVWSASYDGEPAGVLALQRELSAAIAEQLRLRISPQRMSALARRHTAGPEAFDLYLRGRSACRQLTPETTDQAIERYERATQLDPAYALAWSALADAWTSKALAAGSDRDQARRAARAAAERSASANADLAEAQTSLALVTLLEGGGRGEAETRLRRAISLDPAYEPAHRLLGLVFSQSGRPDQAQRAIRRSRELEPLLSTPSAAPAGFAEAGLGKLVGPCGLVAPAARDRPPS